MDMSSKMDGSAPVSQALDGVWGIQKKGRRVADQHNESRKKGKDDKAEKEEFEDGLVPKEEEMTAAAEAEVEKEEVDSESKDGSPAAIRKIDIVI